MYSTYAYRAQAHAVAIGSIILVILALVAAIVTYVIFLSKKNENRFSGFVGWLYDFLSFRKLAVEAILIVLYIFAAILITVMGLFSLFQEPYIIGGICIIIFGNIILRILYEFLIIQILICKNTSDISKKLGKLTNSSTGSIPGFSDAPMDDYSNPEPPKPSNECPVCGKKLKPTAKFCPYCGSRKE